MLVLSSKVTYDGIHFEDQENLIIFADNIVIINEEEYIIYEKEYHRGEFYYILQDSFYLVYEGDRVDYVTYYDNIIKKSYMIKQFRFLECL